MLVNSRIAFCLWMYHSLCMHFFLLQHMEQEDSTLEQSAPAAVVMKEEEVDPVVVRQMTEDEVFTPSSSTQPPQRPRDFLPTPRPDRESSSDPAAPDQLMEKAQNAFSAIEEFVQGELQVTVNDYRVLADMNRVGSQKYSDMHQTAVRLAKSYADLNERYRALQPYLDQIQQLEDNVGLLEEAAYRLDAYVKKLEMQYKKLVKH